MDDVGKFSIVVDGREYDANTIMNFELYGDYYCIYGIKNEDEDYDIYCGQIIGNTVVPIENEKNKNLTDKIVLALTNAIKEGE